MKAMQMLCLVAVVLLVTASPALAQTTTTPQTSVFSGAGVGAGIGAALVIVGAALGFGRIGAAALESMARQPEIRGNIQTAMIIIAALLEGATFFALLICLLVNQRTGF